MPLLVVDMVIGSRARTSSVGLTSVTERRTKEQGEGKRRTWFGKFMIPVEVLAVAVPLDAIPAASCPPNQSVKRATWVREVRASERGELRRVAPISKCLPLKDSQAMHAMIHTFEQSRQPGQNFAERVAETARKLWQEKKPRRGHIRFAGQKQQTTQAGDSSADRWILQSVT